MRQGVFFMDKPIDVLRDFPIRKGKKRKAAFREAVLAYGRKLGYDCRVEKGSLGARNVVLGDPETAKYLITAHYDTCARLPFPNLITPCSFWLFMAWQLLLVVILCVPVGLLGGLIGYALNDVQLGIGAAYFLLLLEMVLMLVGPANRSNANDNTSGVVTVLEIAAALPDSLKSQVCFVLFDLEESGLLGSSSYRSTHRKASSRQVIFNLDCVGEGDEILLFPTKKVKKNLAQMERCRKHLLKHGNKSLSLRDKGFAIYPSDQVNFPQGFGIASFCRSKWAGLYLAKIHTGKDKILDENNVALLRDYLIAVISEQP